MNNLFEGTHEGELMTHRWKPVRDERGQGTVVLVVALVIVAIAVVLLVRTQALASSVNKKTSSIAATGRGINTATDAILQLSETNRLAASIESSTDPLESEVRRILEVIQAIDGQATSINNTANTINGTARGINGTASAILGTAQSIDRGVEQINRNVDVTIGLLREIHGDLNNIIGVSSAIHRDAACIDQAATGSTDGHCG
ncbi:MAG: hypothetical protein M3179_03670 [Actinomycetota bacterium]|nr:hypothetical protein [Actinomycetota bacterium]